MRFGVREILFVIVLLAVPVAAFLFVFQPRNADIAQAKGEIAEKRQTLDRLGEASAKMRDLGIAIEEGREAIRIIEDKLPAEQNVDDVLRQASEIARTHSLQIRSFEAEKKLPASQYMELPIQCEMSGDFDGFYRFLLELEKMPRLTQIRNLNIQRSEDTPGQMTATFTLSVYFQPRPEAAKHLAGANP